MATLSRKDVARLLDITVDQVRKNEESLGIRRWRLRFNARFIRYRKDQTIMELEQRKLIGIC